MSLKTVAIFGATGGLGFPIAKALLESGKFEITIVRRSESSDEKTQELVAKGAKLVVVDVSNHDALVAVLKGIDAVLSVIGGYSYLVQEPLIKAAEEAGVKRFIPSEFGIDTIKHSDGPLTGKVKISQMLKESSMEYTVIMQGGVMNFWPWLGFDMKAKKATIIGSGDEKLAATSLVDLAKYVVAVLAHPDLTRNKIIRVAGDHVSLHDALALYEKATGVKWEVTYKPFDSVTEPQEKFRAYLLSCGTLDDLDNHLFPEVKPVTFAEFVATSLDC